MSDRSELGERSLQRRKNPLVFHTRIWYFCGEKSERSCLMIDEQPSRSLGFSHTGRASRRREVGETTERNRREVTTVDKKSNLFARFTRAVCEFTQPLQFQLTAATFMSSMLGRVQESLLRRLLMSKHSSQKLKVYSFIFR